MRNLKEIKFSPHIFFLFSITIFMSLSIFLDKVWVELAFIFAISWLVSELIKPQISKIVPLTIILLSIFTLNNIKNNNYQTNFNSKTTYTQKGKWKIAEPDKVFVSPKGYCYTQVVNPPKFKYITKEQAIYEGYKMGTKSNDYVIP